MAAVQWNEPQALARDLVAPANVKFSEQGAPLQECSQSFVSYSKATADTELCQLFAVCGNELQSHIRYLQDTIG